MLSLSAALLQMIPAFHQDSSLPGTTQDYPSFSSASPAFMASSLHQKHLLSIIPPQFLMSGIWTDFSKPGLVTKHKALQLRYILEYDLQESSFPRKNCFNPGNTYSTSHTLLYLLHFSASPSHVPELQKESAEPLQGQQAEYPGILWSVSGDAKHSAALHPTPTVKKCLIYPHFNAGILESS